MEERQERTSGGSVLRSALTTTVDGVRDFKEDYVKREVVELTLGERLPYVTCQRQNLLCLP